MVCPLAVNRGKLLLQPQNPIRTYMAVAVLGYDLLVVIIILESIRAEAHASYKAAVEMVEHGKKEKVGG